MNEAKAHQALDRLRGVWRTSGRLLTGDHAGKTFRGTDAYKWLPGGKFLFHTWDVRMPDGRARGVEILGADKEARGLTAYSFDDGGGIVRMKLTVRGGLYRFLGEMIRFTGRLKPRELAGVWEHKSGDAWRPWMRVSLTRAR